MTKPKTILLICSAGITTGLLVKNMKNASRQQNTDVEIYSAPAIIAEQVIRDQEVDALLIGPQAEYEIVRLKDALNYKNIPYKLISNEDYELLNGRKILSDALKMMGMG